MVISYEGTTDKKTFINLTNHSYFNLSGDVKTDILHHELTLKSNQFLELSEALLPTGNLLDMQNTASDFREGRKIKDGVTSDHPQFKTGAAFSSQKCGLAIPFGLMRS